jgi:hypothetical protein
MDIEPAFVSEQQQQQQQENESSLVNKRPLVDVYDETVEFEFFEDFVIDPTAWEAVEKIEEMGYMYTHIASERPIVIVKTALKSPLNQNEILYGFTIFFQFEEDISLNRVGSFYIPRNKPNTSLLETDECKISVEHSLLQIANRYDSEGPLVVMKDLDEYYTDFLDVIDMLKVRDKVTRKKVVAKRQQKINS